jgi:hypothetical protein
MKYLLIALLLSACASKSDYRQGCIDGQFEMIKSIHKNMVQVSEWLAIPENEAYVKDSLDQSVCIPLENARQPAQKYPRGK